MTKFVTRVQYRSWAKCFFFFFFGGGGGNLAERNITLAPICLFSPSLHNYCPPPPAPSLATALRVCKIVAGSDIFAVFLFTTRIAENLAVNITSSGATRSQIQSQYLKFIDKAQIQRVQGFQLRRTNGNHITVIGL